MRRASIYLALLIAPCLQAHSQESTVSVFRGVNVLPMDGQHILRDQTVVVRNGRIHTMGRAEDISAPQGALVIDGLNRYLVGINDWLTMGVGTERFHWLTAQRRDF